jgi:hypothetical protein
VREDGDSSARSAGIDWTLADITRARTVLGWRPVRSLVDTAEAIWAETRPVVREAAR